MTYDLKITGGLLVDGSGGEPVPGAVGIKDGLIVAVGECSGLPSRSIDAESAMITPEFTDLHSHYDCQVS